MEVRTNRSSSPTSLSSPPSALSEPGSPTRFLNQGRANIEMDEIVVDPGSAARFGILPGQPIPPTPPAVPLTAAGLPRKKPGRKPKVAVEGGPSSTTTDAAKKTRRPRKPRDPDAPPIQRKRKAPAADLADGPATNENRPFPGAAAATSRQPQITELTSMRMSLDTPRSASVAAGSVTVSTGPDSYGLKMPKRESMPGSMDHILNSDEPPYSRPQPPAPTPPPTRQIFDPVRGNYDPVRETMTSRHDPYGTGPLGSPRAPSSSAHRARASPSIASLVDPTPSTTHHILSPPPPQQSYNSNKASTTLPPRFHESTSVPPSPSHAVRTSQTQAVSKPPKPSIIEVKRTPIPPPPQPQSKSMEPPKNNFTSMSSIPVNGLAGTSAPVQNKKVATVAQKEREKHKTSTSSSSPNVASLKDALPALPPASGRSILDFGKANPGEETQAPSIVLHIPLNGESNKVVNFMRMAEEAYGWDALHPRLAAHRERKARIAAASAELAKQGSGRESGDEMSVDLQSDNEASNVEMGGMGNGVTGGPASGPDGAPVKAKRKRVNKEDEYDKEDDFVDDSELLWEEQAAASRDGFFVYSGPLIPEVEKPPAGYVQLLFFSFSSSLVL